MKTILKISTILLLTVLVLSCAHHQREVNNLSSTEGLTTHNADIEAVRYQGKRAIKAQISPQVLQQMTEDQARLQATGNARGPAAFESIRKNHLIVVDDDFQNGTIELVVSGEPAPGASGDARGFVGVAFRVQEDLKTYDCFYIRPTNGRADDQERRNHAVQYVSHPEHTWFRFRADSPGKYESYVDLLPATWTKLKIVVEGERAELYVHGNDQPTLIVKDLKTGADGKGAVALWFEGSTVAHYSDLKITK